MNESKIDLSIQVNESIRLYLPWQSVAVKTHSITTIWLLDFLFLRRGSTNRIVSNCIASLKDDEGKNSPGLAIRNFIWNKHRSHRSIRLYLQWQSVAVKMHSTTTVWLLDFLFLKRGSTNWIVSIYVASLKDDEGKNSPGLAIRHFYGAIIDYN